MSNKFFSLLILGTLLTGCNSISSSMHYTSGTELLQAGKYEAAIEELEQAVDLDPSMARNHTNLATAYWCLGEPDKTWYHYRQAVLAPNDDGHSRYNFQKFYELQLKKPGLTKAGTSAVEIIDKLGFPDILIMKGESISFCIYGICSLNFVEGKLTECLLDGKAVTQ